MLIRTWQIAKVALNEGKKVSRRAWPPTLWIETTGQENRFQKHTANGNERYVPNHEDRVAKDWYEI